MAHQRAYELMTIVVIALAALAALSIVDANPDYNREEPWRPSVSASGLSSTSTAHKNYGHKPIAPRPAIVTEMEVMCNGDDMCVIIITTGKAALTLFLFHCVVAVASVLRLGMACLLHRRCWVAKVGVLAFCAYMCFCIFPTALYYSSTFYVFLEVLACVFWISASPVGLWASSKMMMWMAQAINAAESVGADGILKFFIYGTVATSFGVAVASPMLCIILLAFGVDCHGGATACILGIVMITVIVTVLLSAFTETQHNGIAQASVYCLFVSSLVCVAVVEAPTDWIRGCATEDEAIFARMFFVSVEVLIVTFTIHLHASAMIMKGIIEFANTGCLPCIDRCSPYEPDSTTGADSMVCCPGDWMKTPVVDIVYTHAFDAASACALQQAMTMWMTVVFDNDTGALTSTSHSSVVYIRAAIIMYALLNCIVSELRGFDKCRGEDDWGFSDTQSQTENESDEGIMCGGFYFLNGKRPPHVQ